LSIQGRGPDPKQLQSAVSHLEKVVKNDLPVTRKTVAAARILFQEINSQKTPNQELNKLGRDLKKFMEGTYVAESKEPLDSTPDSTTKKKGWFSTIKQMVFGGEKKPVGLSGTAYRINNFFSSVKHRNAGGSSYDLFRKEVTQGSRFLEEQASQAGSEGSSVSGGSVKGASQEAQALQAGSEGSSVSGGSVKGASQEAQALQAGSEDRSVSEGEVSGDSLGTQASLTDSEGSSVSGGSVKGESQEVQASQAGSEVRENRDIDNFVEVLEELTGEMLKEIGEDLSPKENSFEALSEDTSFQKLSEEKKESFKKTLNLIKGDSSYLEGLINSVPKEKWGPTEEHYLGILSSAIEVVDFLLTKLD
jgi:hypothetical protein